MWGVGQESVEKYFCFTNLFGAFGRFNQLKDIHELLDEVNLDL